MRHSSAKRKRRPEEGSCLPLLRATLALPRPCRAPAGSSRTRADERQEFAG